MFYKILIKTVRGVPDRHSFPMMSGKFTVGEQEGWVKERFKEGL